MNGAPASLASRRAISVLPTPVGPMSMMFLGAISSRMGGGTCCRRQRLRKATATARLAARWPTMYRSSSSTIARGVNDSAFFEGMVTSQLLEGGFVVGVDADVRGDPQRPFGDLAGRQLGLRQEGAGRSQRVGATRAHRRGVGVRLDHVAGAGQEQDLL